MEKKYKHSAYNVEIKLADDRFLLYNTFRQGMLEINSGLYSKFRELEMEPGKELDKFLEYGFLTDSLHDELGELKFRHRQTKFDNEYINITIQTTDACNFRCKYCYQEHKAKHMNRATVTKLTKFLDKKIAGGMKNICIHWFGGEPLLCTEPITAIEKHLADKKINHKATLTTNGYLLTGEMLSQLADTKIYSIQITVDGIKSRHNRTRVLADGGGTFDTIINNIKSCMEMRPDLQIIIRLNITRHNSQITEFLKYLKETNLKNKNIKLHITEAKEHSLSYTDEDIFFNNPEEYAQELENLYNSLLDYDYEIPRYSVNGVACEFDCINNFLIDTEGNIFQCTSSEKDDVFTLGRITGEGEVDFKRNNLITKMLREPFTDPECRNCKVLPWCMGGCNYLAKKNKTACIPEKYILDNLVKIYYCAATGKRIRN